MKVIHQGWKGGFIAHYFGHLEDGEWVDIPYCKYLWLKLNGYTVRKLKHYENPRGYKKPVKKTTKKPTKK